MGTIVVGLDGSSLGHGVLASAAALAAPMEAMLFLVRVVTAPVETRLDAGAWQPGSLIDLLEQEGHETLTQLAATLPRGIRYEERVAIGKPWKVICALASEREAELVVIGAHGYGRIDRLLGTTAARIVDHAPCSVLVVRPGTARDYDADAASA